MPKAYGRANWLAEGEELGSNILRSDDDPRAQNEYRPALHRRSQPQGERLRKFFRLYGAS
jgi:hypothetical protein